METVGNDLCGPRGMPIGCCRLCGETKRLHDSHVIPEFLWQPLYDEKHRAILGEIVPEVREKTIQKGIRERLLCSTCERAFGKLEHYGKTAIDKFLDNIASARSQTRRLTVQGLDGQEVWKLILSIVWRAHVSSDPVFAKVQLGSHEESLRALLLGKSALLEDYPCVIVGRRPGRTKGAAILSPDRIRFQGCIVYRFHLPRLMWIAFVSSHAPCHSLAPFLPNAGGGLTGVISLETEDSFIDRLVKQAAAAYQRAGRR